MHTVLYMHMVSQREMSPLLLLYRSHYEELHSSVLFKRWHSNGITEGGVIGWTEGQIWLHVHPESEMRNQLAIQIALFKLPWINISDCLYSMLFKVWLMWQWIIIPRTFPSYRTLKKKKICGFDTCRIRLFPG